MTVRAALIGAGNIGARHDEEKRGDGVFTHAGAYVAQGNISLVAAADCDAVRLAAFQTHWHCPNVFSDWHELLAAGPYDLISICSPDAAHAEQLRAILQLPAGLRPRIVWVEKPPASLAAETRELALLAERQRVAVAVNFQRRWEPQHIRLRDNIAAGRWGGVLDVTARYVRGLRHNGITVINTVAFLAGAVGEKVEILSEGGGVSGDPSVSWRGSLVSGAPLLVHAADLNGYQFSIFEIDIMLERGRVRVVDNGERMAVSELCEYSHFPGFRALAPPVIVETQMSKAMAHAAGYMAAVAAGAPHTVNTLAEACADLAVIERVRSAAGNG